jgi:predicted lipoprotein
MIHYGPIGDDLRYDRMAHWPERRNAVGRALAAQLSAAEPPTVARLRQASVAAQGFTALERLLFGEDGKGPEREGKAALRRQRCGLGLAIAANLAGTARETLAGWQGPQGLLTRLERKEPGEAREAVTRFVTDALALLETIKDAKIGMVLGKGGADAARPELAEGWRSGRSLRAIALDIDSVAACIRLLLADRPDAAPWLAAAGETARRLTAEIAPATLGDAAADPGRRFKVILLRDAIETWRLVAMDPIAQQLGVTIGFNSSDGD